MTGRSLCLTCLHNHDGLCLARRCGLWWIPTGTMTDCRWYIHDSQGSSAEGFR